MKRIINYSVISLGILLLGSCRKSVTDIEVPSSSVDAIVTSSDLAVSGGLLWFKHIDYLNGTYNWANDAAGTEVSLGSGWAGYKSVFATNNGVIYAIRTDGKLIWYKHNGYLNGNKEWANGGVGIEVGLGSGWADFKSVFATNNGVIYAIQKNGKLIEYKHNGYLNGTKEWANGGVGIEVGLASGWAEFKSVFATNNGVIYGIQTDGKLIWYKHNGFLNGTKEWANGGVGVEVGLASGWAGFKSVLATNRGVIYGIQTDGKLIWYKHNGFLDGTSRWANHGAGKQVGTGWNAFKSAFATNSGVIYGINP